MHIPRANLYERDEIDGLYLPGFNRPASLRTALREGSHWDTVLSATIVSTNPDGDLEVLTAIRRRETNATHPDVVSTPTMRVPKQFARSMVMTRAEITDVAMPKFIVKDVKPTEPVVVMGFPGNAEPIPNNISQLPSLAGNLLATKLGAADSLEAGTVDNPVATVSLRTVLAGFSYAASRMRKGEEEVPLYEPLLMLGTVINVKDRGIIPDQTASYRRLGWVGIDSYKAGHEMRDAGLLVPDLGVGEETDVCVRGLCLLTSKAIVSDIPALIEHFGDNTQPDPSHLAA